MKNNMTRSKKLKLNTIFGMSYQLVLVVTGFILPRLILGKFGSDINGLVNSIKNYLSFIGLLEGGVGAVVLSNLYKPLAKNNDKKISEIYVSARKFFRTIAFILVIYVILLMIFYPYIVDVQFSHIYISSLILAISISYFSLYYFGIVDGLLLSADQLKFIESIINIILSILNIICTIAFIKLNFGIHIIMLTSSLAFFIRPLILRMYVSHNYKIDRKITYEKEPIKQKWNGMAQHIAFVVLNQTDIIVLSSFSNMKNVSIYSVYTLVITGIKTIIFSVVGGFDSIFGELWAKNEKDKLQNLFDFYHWLIHNLTILFYGCTFILIIPFIKVYTKGITDTNYIQNLFSSLLIFANAFIIFRLPYTNMILAAGHYKQTQWNYIATAIINIVISILSVKKYGLVGVAIGTLIALVFQTCYQAIYTSKHLIKINYKHLLKQILIDIFIFITASIITQKFKLSSPTYISWAILSIKVFSIWAFILILLNIIFYKKYVKSIFNKITSKF